MGSGVFGPVAPTPGTPSLVPDWPYTYQSEIPMFEPSGVYYLLRSKASAPVFETRKVAIPTGHASAVEPCTKCCCVHGVQGVQAVMWREVSESVEAATSPVNDDSQDRLRMNLRVLQDFQRRATVLAVKEAQKSGAEDLPRLCKYIMTKWRLQNALFTLYSL